MSKIMDTEDLIGDQDLLDIGQFKKEAAESADAEKKEQLGAKELVNSMKGMQEIFLHPVREPLLQFKTISVKQRFRT